VKTFLLKCAAMTAVSAMLIMTLNYVLDPLCFYRFPSQYRAQYSTNARHQLPGFIRNAEYDTILVGTSMSRNFRESHVDRVLGGTSLNAALPAGTAREQRLAAELALSTRPVKRIIWELNFYSFARAADDVEDDQDDFPYHLWDMNVWNDWKYLFNPYPLERMFDIWRANRNGSEQNRDREMLFKFGFDQPPLTLAKVRELVDIPNAASQSNYRESVMMRNFRANVLETVRAHPDTEFWFFYPPYAVFWHVRAQKTNANYIQEITRTKVAMYRELSRFPNAKLYDFQDRAEITHRIDHYMDVAHYFPYMNDRIIEMMANEPPLSSEDEAVRRAKTLEEQVLGFDESRLTIGQTP